MVATRRNVFLDTEVFRSAQFNWESDPLRIFSSLVTGGRVHLLVTDITVREIRQHLRDDVDSVCHEHARFVRESKGILFRSTNARAKDLLQPPDRDALVEERHADLEHFLHRLGATVVDCSQLSLGQVLDDYFAIRPPFENKSRKRAEFPDAFALQALRQWCAANQAEVIVVSRDKGMGKACGDGLRHVETLVRLLDEIASDEGERTEFVRREITERLQSVSEDAAPAFFALGFVVDDDHGEVEEVDLLDVDCELEVMVAEVGAASATAFVVTTFGYCASVALADHYSVEGPEGEETFTGTIRERVNGRVERLLEIRATFNRLDPRAFVIESIADAHPQQEVLVTRSRRTGYPWK